MPLSREPTRCSSCCSTSFLSGSTRSTCAISQHLRLIQWWWCRISRTDVSNKTRVVVSVTSIKSRAAVSGKASDGVSVTRANYKANNLDSTRWIYSFRLFAANFFFFFFFFFDQSRTPRTRIDPRTVHVDVSFLASRWGLPWPLALEWRATLVENVSSQNRDIFSVLSTFKSAKQITNLIAHQ